MVSLAAWSLVETCRWLRPGGRNRMPGADPIGSIAIEGVPAPRFNKQK
jgi:hypothetical protein